MAIACKNKSNVHVHRSVTYLLATVGLVIGILLFVVEIVFFTWYSQRSPMTNTMDTCYWSLIRSIHLADGHRTCHARYVRCITHGGTRSSLCRNCATLTLCDSVMSGNGAHFDQDLGLGCGFEDYLFGAFVLTPREIEIDVVGMTCNRIACYFGKVTSIRSTHIYNLQKLLKNQTQLITLICMGCVVFME